MPKKLVVRVKDKFQVTLPAKLRKQATVAVGDLLEVSVQHGAYVLQIVETRPPRNEKDHDE